MLPTTKLTLDYALECRRQQRLDIERHEKILCYRYPLYQQWRENCADGENIANEDQFRMAEKSGAFRSYEWLAMYMAIARRDVWSEIASILCRQEHGEHDFTTDMKLNGESCGQACKHCGCAW